MRPIDTLHPRAGRMITPPSQQPCYADCWAASCRAGADRPTPGEHPHQFTPAINANPRPLNLATSRILTSSHLPPTPIPELNLYP